MYLAGELKLGMLITHKYQLENINRAFDNLEQGNVGALIGMREYQT